MNSELTPETLIELASATASNINSQFELWLTITFAVIIASYLAGHRLSRPLQYLIATLYLLVSILLLLMLVSAVRFAEIILGDAGFMLTDETLRWAIVVLRIVVWSLGTVATLVFIFKGHRSTEGS